MTPIKQTLLYDENSTGNGNCVAACYASLLDIPLWMVPPFESMHGRPDRTTRINFWFQHVHKVELIVIFDVNRPEHQDDEDKANLAALPEFYIAMGPSPRGDAVTRGHHAVVYSAGKMVHDPHFSNDDILEVTRIEYLRPVPRVARTREGDLK